MFETIDRIVVAVRDLDKAKKQLSNLLNVDFDLPLVDEEYHMRAVYSLFGLELVESTKPGSIIDQYLDARGEGVFRVVIKVTELDSAVKHLEMNGVHPVGEITVGELHEVAFHPKDFHGIQIVLAEYSSNHPATIAALKTP